MASKIIDKIVDLDLYGHPIGVHYNGRGTYKTKLGALFTLAAYALVLFNFITLSMVFMNGKRREEKF